MIHCSGADNPEKFFSFAVMMLNINSEPARQNTVRFTLTTPMAFTGSSWGVEIKGTALQAMLEPAPSSDWIVPTANEGLIAPNCFASQRCDTPPPLLLLPPPPPSHLSLLCQRTNLAAGRCAATFPQSPSSLNLHFQLCNSFILLGTGERCNQNNYLSPILFRRRLVFFHVNLQPEWNRLCLGGFLWNITKAAAVTKQEKLQWHAGSTSGFITWLFQQEIHNQLTKKRKKKEEENVWTQSSHLDTFTHTVMRRHPLIKSCGIYSNPDQRVENKAGALARFTTVTSRDCYLFSQKGKEREKKQGCLNAKLYLQCDPNSWEERQHNVLADQGILDFDETKWAHHEI